MGSDEYVCNSICINLHYYNEIPEAVEFIKKRGLLWVSVLEAHIPRANKACWFSHWYQHSSWQRFEVAQGTKLGLCMCDLVQTVVSLLIKPLGCNHGSSALMTLTISFPKDPTFNIIIGLSY